MGNKRLPERRAHPRIALYEKVALQPAATVSGMAPGMTIFCGTVNISQGGLQIRSDSPLPARCRVALWIDVAGAGKFFLDGEVKWQAEDENDGGYLVGIAIDEAKSADVHKWKAFLQTLSPPNEQYLQSVTSN